MNIKQAIIDTNNALCYIVIALVFIVGTVVGATSSPLLGAIVIGIGWMVCCLLYGFWFAIVSLLEETQKQTVLLEKLYKTTIIIKKQNEPTDWEA